MEAGATGHFTENYPHRALMTRKPKLANAAARRRAEEDADDLVAFGDRAGEPRLDFQNVVRELKKRGKL